MRRQDAFRRRRVFGKNHRTSMRLSCRRLRDLEQYVELLNVCRPAASGPDDTVEAVADQGYKVVFTGLALDSYSGEQQAARIGSRQIRTRQMRCAAVHLRYDRFNGAQDFRRRQGLASLQIEERQGGL
ncbi:hypothetical protein EMEDMD4_130041 [Sinorhizobium medicae]|uniref:Uncharacterized protein n=1 Tax=Sinorhizobium medicae TaxID=110321 RepID=A0A508WR70_9HYPH|nr:hypothetical protein EMEDMD4_130041 [Sinorhizobium medicae]